MRTTVLLVLFIFICIGMQAQTLKDDKAVTHFYIVNIDEDLLDVSTSAKVNDKTPSRNEFVVGIIDTFYAIASERFKNELGLELLPLGELQGKVKYNSQYPNCPDMTNIKKVLKNAAGYKYYTDYFVNIFSDNNTDSSVKSAPNRIRPLYAICFTIYDASGKQVKKIDMTYKSRKPLAENKQDMKDLNQQMKSKLSKFYSEALTGFAFEYKKKMTAQL